MPESYLKLLNPLRRTFCFHVRAKATEECKGVITKVKLKEPYLGPKKDGWMDGCQI